MARALPAGIPAVAVVDCYEQAADWSLRRQAAQWSAADEAALAAWLDADPLHREAFEQTALTRDLFERLARPAAVAPVATAVAPAVASAVASAGASIPASLPGPRPMVSARASGSPRSGRRRLLPLALAASLVLALVVGGLGWWHLPAYQSAVATAVGETARLDLPDGSRIDVNVGSRLAVRYFPGRRDVVLDEGEAFFTVAGDPWRPFTVTVGDNRIRVVGTAFNVQASPRRLVIKVSEGQVTVRPGLVRPGQGGASGPELALGPRGLLILDRSTGQVIAGVTEVEAIGGWRSGQVRFRRTPLAEVADEVARYLGKPVALDGPELGQLPISGFFATASPDAFVELLPALAPVNVARRPEGGWTVSANRTGRR